MPIKLAERLNVVISEKRIAKMAALAHDLDVDESAISRWRHGGAISLENASRLCLQLNVSMDWLVLGRGRMEPAIELSITHEEMAAILSLRSVSSSYAEIIFKLVSMIAEKSNNTWFIDRNKNLY